MALPKGIKREHIFQAIIRIEREEIPSRREAREWALLYEAKQYPCKLLVSWANIYANGAEWDSKHFITYEAQELLKELKFNIISI